MRKLEDAFGSELRLNDYVAYAVRKSSSQALHIGRVWKITWENGRYKVSIVATGNRWDWNRKPFEYFGAYKTTLTANHTLLLLDILSVPEKVKAAITEYDITQNIWT